MPDDLHNLLRDVDRSLAAPPVAQEGLARRVYVRRRQRRTVRGGAALAVLALAAFSPLWWMQIGQEGGTRTAHHDLPASHEQWAPLRVELVGLTNDIARHARTADSLVAAEKRRAMEERAAAAQPRWASRGDEPGLDETRTQRDRAATTLVAHADRLAALADARRAEELYNLAIQLFPDTPAAAVALRRLGSREPPQQE